VEVYLSSIYLDYQAATPIDRKVVDEMMPYLTEHYGNPHSSEHAMGWQANQAVEDARQKIANLINADSDEVFFTSGATESNNLAIQGSIKGPYFDSLYVTKIEHKSSLECARQLHREGYRVSFLAVNNKGQVTREELYENLQHKHPLVSVIGVNNEIGTIQNIKAISDVVHDRGGCLHIDAAQMPAAMDIDVQTMGIDLLSLSSHKIYGPKGIGALYISREIQDKITPIMLGGGQENGLRSGTLPTPLIVGFGGAVSIILHEAESKRARLRRLARLLFSMLSERIPNIQLNGPSFEDRHPGNLNIRIPDVNARTLLEMLQPTIAASTGSACSSGLIEPSYVLQAIGLSRQEAQESLRLSVGAPTTEDEVCLAAELISKKVEEIRSI